MDIEVRHRVEGALLLSGLLHAVVTADGRARTGDAVLDGQEPWVAGRETLACVL